MKAVRHSLSALALTLLSASAFASSVTFTDRSVFQAGVLAGSYTESFDGLSDPPAGAVPFSGGAFAYSAFAASDIYLSGGFLGTSQIDEALTITFTGGNVTAIGADFFTTDISDAFQSVLVDILLSDGTHETFTPTSLADSFRGFHSDVAITSLTISAPGQSLYAGLDNLTVGSVQGSTNVPEPASLALVGLGFAGLLASRRRAA